MSDFRNKVQSNKTQAESEGLLNTIDVYDLALQTVLPSLLGVSLSPCRYESSLCFHKAYMAESPNLPSDITGVDGFKVYQSKNRDTLKEAMREYQELADGRKVVRLENISQDAIDSCLTLVRPVFSTKVTAPSSSEFYRIADKLSQTDDAPPKGGVRELGITLNPSPDTTAKAFMPTHEQFPDRIKELTGADIITLFSGAELEAFMMAWGSVIVGPKNSRDVCTGEIYRHAFRQVIVLQGDSKVGKSFLMEKLTMEILPILGYTYSTLPKDDFKETFGLARPASANVTYKDDLDQKDFVNNWLECGYLKTWGSQGLVNTQEKNKDSVLTMVNTRVFGCINNLDSSVFVNGDFGVLNRVWILQHVSKADAPNVELPGAIANASPNKMLYDHIPYLAEQYNVDETTIYIWFLRLCADKFLEETAKEPALEKYCTALPTKFKFQTNRNPAKSLALALIFCTRLCVKDYKADTPIGSLKASSLVKGFRAFAAIACVHSDAAHMIKNIVHQDWKQQGRPNTHPWVAFRELDYTNIAAAEQLVTSKPPELLMMNSRAKGGEYEKMLDILFSGLRTSDTGDKVIASPANFKLYWNEHKTDYFIELFDKLKPLIKGITYMTEEDYKFCASSHYDSKLIADKLNNDQEPA